MSSYIKKFAPNTSETSISEAAKLLAKKAKRQGSNQCMEDIDKDTSEISSAAKKPSISPEEKSPDQAVIDAENKRLEKEKKEEAKKKQVEETYKFLTRKPKRQGSNQVFEGYVIKHLPSGRFLSHEPNTNFVGNPLDHDNPNRQLDIMKVIYPDDAEKLAKHYGKDFKAVPYDNLNTPKKMKTMHPKSKRTDWD